MKELYNNLMALCENDDTPFFFSEQGTSAEHYRIFSYHFTDKDSWLHPDALEARGIMFEVDHITLEPIRIAARTMPKFFNKGEVDFIEYGAPAYAMTKADGSLISSYKDRNGVIKTKSKTSINSDYALLAENILYNDIELYDFVKWCEHDGYTVNMELVSPDPEFRIVLYYDRSQLIILNVRHRDTGEYMDMRSLPKKYFTGTVDLDVLNHLDTAKNVEGYVVVDEFNNWWKEKCAWYLERHRAKDFINQPNAFVELVLKDEADDVFALLEDQPVILLEMQELQHKVITRANQLINSVTAYWQANKDLNRKDYAIKGKDELTHYEFTLAMRYYTLEEAPDWNKQFLQWVKKYNWTE